MNRFVAGLVLILPSIGAAQTDDDWISLFNGVDLSGWTPKIRHYAAGENFGNTFRVDDGLLTVSYDQYANFDESFGHLFYDQPFSHYRLIVEYRFTGEQLVGGPDWAIRNSGAMLHSQSPATMPDEQDFPISIEVQFLGGLSDGHERSTGNLCTPGTNVVYQGEFTTAHCINSTSPTLNGDQWVLAEMLVLGGDRMVHRINGDVVIEYTNMTTGGGAVSGHRPELQPEGESLSKGYIALQSESHPVQFRRVELLDLKGCMDQASPRFRSWYVEPDAAACD
jgi:hypothetical protein